MYNRIPPVWKDALLHNPNVSPPVNPLGSLLSSATIDTKSIYSRIQSKYSSLPHAILRKWEVELNIAPDDSEWVQFIGRYKQLTRIKWLHTIQQQHVVT